MKKGLLKTLIAIIAVSTIMLTGCKTTVKQEKLPAEKQQLLYYGGNLATRNSLNYDTLSTNIKLIAETLEEYWGISDEESAIDTLDWLLQEGHRTDGDEILAVLKAGQASEYEGLGELEALYEECNEMLVNEFKFDKSVIEKVNSIGAWDYDRMVNVARWCYNAGYINEEVAWSYIDKAKELANKSFDSWEEYYISNTYGRSIAYDGDPQDLLEVGRKLLEDKNSIWNTTDFE